MSAEKKILDESSIKRAITRIVHEILEHNTGTSSLAVVGIQTRGAVLANRIVEQISQIENVQVPSGILDITMYRDDLSEGRAQPVVKGSEINFDVNKKKIILVDDVLFSGRTIRCALDALVDYGRPSCIQLAVLIDRGHRELPIKADYVGKNVPTSLDEEVKLCLTETDGREEAVVRRKE